jgi:hypothetical protein
MSQGDPRKCLHGRKGTRSALGAWCRFMIREYLGVESYVVHEGHAGARSHAATGIQGSFACYSAGPRISRLVEACWTRPLRLEEKEQRYPDNLCLELQA